MQTKELVSFILQLLDAHKAKHITRLDVKHLSHFADVIIIATGTSKRHIRHLSELIIQEAKSRKHLPIRLEAGPPGEWALVDLGDVVVHIMQQDTRDFYQIEKLWQQNSNNPNDADD